jgi:hypothetical protein
MEANVFPLPLYRWEKHPYTFWIGSWVDLFGGLDAVEKKRGLWPLSVHRLSVP